ncbi:MAG: DEAD/DEAH box helicase [Muribaculaceae bacterium]|nr:DEAD/DEAH box helicase [Muribaculaceae bacterium]
MTFEELLYNDDVLDALDAMGFDECTPIQERAIPAVLDGRDLLAVAQTGTGKTAAYLLPVIDLIADGGFPTDAVNCVVMAPTRELAQQIDQQMQGFAYFLPVTSMAIYGGTDGKTFDQQKKSLTMGADVVIATPGRLLAHLKMGYVDLSKVSFFILDEADRMLDMGFYDDIMKIYQSLPDDVQTLMFSATMPPKIRQLARKILKNPAEVKIAVSKPADNIDQSVYMVNDGGKVALLSHIFNETPPERVILFSSSKQKIKELARELRGKFNVAEMHSDLEQEKREQVMLDFRAGRVGVLLATDIVARGIDIDDIAMVINYDVPRDAEDYVHRIGRTARAASSGKAVTLVNDRDRVALARIEKLIEMKVPRKELPAELAAAASGGDRGKSRSKGGKRGGKQADKQGNKTSAKQGDNRKRRGNKPKANHAPDASAQTPKADAQKADGAKRRHRGGRRHRKPGNGTPPAPQS